MMLKLTKTLTAAAFVGALALSSPVLAAKPAKAPADGVEASISELKTQLKITPTEEAQWDAVATVMRDNAKNAQDRYEAREANAATATAIDDLKAYAASAQAHAEDMKKMETAFEALYNTMPDDQKKVADGVFSKQHPGGRGGMAKNKAPKKAD